MERFAHLRTDKSMQRWTENTKFRAPHKPLLLLTVLSQIEGESEENRIYPSLSLHWTSANNGLECWSPVHLQASFCHSFICVAKDFGILWPFLENKTSCTLREP